MLRRDDGAETLELSWTLGGRRSAIRFRGPRSRHSDPSDPLHSAGEVVEHTVRLEGNGLSASALLVSLDTRGSGLVRFVDDLVDDLRGWDGTQDVARRRP